MDAAATWFWEGATSNYGATVALAGAGASVLYVLIRTRSGLGAIMLLIGAMVLVGPLVLFIILSLGPQIAVEREAWARLNNKT